MHDDENKTGEQIKKIGRPNHLIAVTKKGVTVHNKELSIFTIHQIADVILQLATPISYFTVCPEKYGSIYHKAIGDNIEGIKSMLVILDNAYKRIDSTLQETEKN